LGTAQPAGLAVITEFETNGNRKATYENYVGARSCRRPCLNPAHRPATRLAPEETNWYGEAQSAAHEVVFGRSCCRHMYVLQAAI
jgi:hypothetical protein